MNDDMSTAEVATLLGVHGSTVRRYEEEGLIVARRTPGGHRRYSRDSVMDALNSTATEPTIP